VEQAPCAGGIYLRITSGDSSLHVQICISYVSRQECSEDTCMMAATLPPTAIIWLYLLTSVVPLSQVVIISELSQNQNRKTLEDRHPKVKEMLHYGGLIETNTY
jgi:hypothetical protein